MSYKQARNQELTKKFNQLFPGAHSNMTPSTKCRIFQDRAQGPLFWDVDGNEYIDYTGSSGPNILGHGHPEYLDSLQAFLQNHSVCAGSSYRFTEEDILLGEKLVKHIPCAEQVKLCVSGSEAVQQAIRLSRAYTGRPYYLRFGGHYHGWIDNIYGGVPNPPEQGLPFPHFNASCNTLGKSEPSNREGLMLPWGDMSMLEQTLEKFADKIAIIIMEPIWHGGLIMPKPGYLETIRALCDRYDVVLCFDEVVTGFRVGLQGAQGLLGVKPDICTLGKALGGGMPISAVVGKAEIIGQLKDRKVLGQGTFNGLPICVRAARTTLDILARDNGAIYKEMDRVQRSLMSGLDIIARHRGVPVRIQGTTGSFATFFGADPDRPIYSVDDMVDIDQGMAAVFQQKMWREGVSNLSTNWYSSIAHTDQESEKVLTAFEKVLSTL